jgi:serpin B
MIMIVPDPGAFKEFEAGFNVSVWKETLDTLEPTRVEISLPQFEYDSGFALRPVFESMGMVDPFSIDAADFSGMDGSLELYIHDVLHKAFVAVDEEGTEAAAATAVIIASKAMLDPPVEIKVNRPFLFLIRDLETDTVLFMGRVLNPAQ